MDDDAEEANVAEQFHAQQLTVPAANTTDQNEENKNDTSHHSNSIITIARKQPNPGDESSEVEDMDDGEGSQSPQDGDYDQQNEVMDRNDEDDESGDRSDREGS